VRLPQACLDDLRNDLFTEKDFAKITAKVALVPDERAMIAEGDCGASFTYGEDFRYQGEPPSADEWLGVRPIPDEFD
jgi:hypothetical protein